MKNKVFIVLLSLISILGISSCEVEFNPNDDWKETTIVYGILDQDADTNFVRIERCFLGKGNYIEFSKIKDSIYYKKEDISVTMYGFYEWEITNDWDTTKARDKYYFDYTEVNKDLGNFHNEKSPIYYTTKKIIPDYVYYLIVRNLKTGSITTSHTKLVADYKIMSPSGNLFKFTSNAIYDYRKVMKCQWTSQTPNSKGETPRLFQPCVRFNFMENGQLAYVNIPLNNIPNPFSVADKTISNVIFEDDVLNGIKNKIQKRGIATRKFVSDSPAFEIIIYGCADELKNYIDNNSSEVSLTEKPNYTNIKNGVGIFSSRRVHIKKTYTEWEATFQKDIENSNIGF